MKHTFLYTFALMITLAIFAPSVQARDWDNLGSRKVSFRGETDTIVVSRNENRFTAIKLDVDSGNIVLHKLVVTFGDGSTFSPSVQHHFKEGMRSRTIDLPGRSRRIRTVKFWYRSTLRRGRATMTLYGKKGHKAVVVTPVKHRWDNLGTRSVSFRSETDTIVVSRNENRFTAIKLDVDSGNIVLHKLVVTFGDGSTFSPSVQHHFKEGERSRTIDLPGRSRRIRTVKFWYRSTLRRGRATMTLYGKHGGSAVVVTPPVNTHRWTNLGSRSVSFRSEKDVIVVTGNEGRFRAIKIEVSGGNLYMYNIRVTFGDGSHFSPSSKISFKEGERSRTIDLPGKSRIIRKIEFWYKSTKRRGKAKVTVHGKH